METCSSSLGKGTGEGVASFPEHKGNGFPNIDSERRRAGYVPMETFPLAGDEVPAGHNGWLVFFDEISSASPAIQAAAYKILLDREIGQYKLHDKVMMVGAGNLETDGAIVEEMSTALQSRMVHLEMQVNHKQWLDWSAEEGLDHRINAFIRFKPDLLYNFKPDHNDRTYASPRTWAFTSALIKGKENIDGLLAVLAGTLGEGVAREFRGFTQIYREMLTVAQIVAKPASVTMPTQPSVLFALTSSIAMNMAKDNVEALMIFVNRLPKEFQVVTLREVWRRKPELRAHQSLTDWISANAQELF